jgi:integrase
MASKTQGKARGKGTGTVWKKGNRFYFRVRVDGTEKNTMLRNADGKPATTRPDAEKAALALTPILLGKSQDDIAEYIVESRKIQNPLVLPLAHVWSTYLAQTSRPDSGESTLGLYEWFWNDFLRWLNEARPSISHLSQVNDEIVQAFFGTLSSRNISGRTYNAYRQALRLIHKHLLPVLEQEHNPFDKIATRLNGSISRREFSEEQVEAIFQGFETGFFYDTEGEVLTKGRERVRVTKKIEFKPMHPEQLKVLLYLCCYTGCRGQDGCLMRWSNVDLPHNRISFTPRKTARKTGKTVIIPLHPVLYEALEEAKQWQNTNQKGQDYILPAIARRYQYNASGIQKDVMKIIRCATDLDTKTQDAPGKRVLAANLYSLHSFRHTFVSFCANAGVSLDIVAEIVGHGSPIMTKHYAHFSNEAKSAILQALPNKTTKTTTPADAQSDQAPEARDELLKMLAGMDPEKVQELLELAQQKKQPKRPSRKKTPKPDEGN